MEKAFNHVCWNFVDYMLERLGFNQKRTNWICVCQGFGQQKDVKISDSLVENRNRVKEWQVLVLRNLNDWEIRAYELLPILSLTTLDGSPDTPQGCLVANESFIVKSFYKKLFQV